MPSASASASQGPPHSPRASSWLPSQSQSPAGMPSPPHATLVDFKDVAVHSRRALQHMGQRRRRCRRRPHRPHKDATLAERVKLVAVAVAVAFRDVVTATDAALVDGSWSVAHRHSRQALQHMGRRRRRSAVVVSPHKVRCTPRASSWLPSSRSRQGFRRRCRTRGRHSANATDIQSHHRVASSQMPSAVRISRTSRHRHRCRTRRGRFRHNRSLLQGCQHIRTRRSRLVRCTRHKRQALQHMGRRRRRCRQRRHRPHKAHRTRRGRQAGCHRSRSRLRDVRDAATDAALVKDVAVAVALIANVHIVVDLLPTPQASSSPTHGSTRISINVASATTSHSPRASSWLPSQSQLPSGCGRTP